MLFEQIFSIFISVVINFSFFYYVIENTLFSNIFIIPTYLFLNYTIKNYKNQQITKKLRKKIVNFSIKNAMHIEFTGLQLKY